MGDLINISLGTAGLIGLLGYLVVFLGLILLMLVVLLLGRLMKRRSGDPAPAPAASALPALRTKTNDGGREVELYGVSPRDAAVIMAIVAHRTGKPLQELHFKSIKEVEKR